MKLFIRSTQGAFVAVLTFAVVACGGSDQPGGAAAQTGSPAADPSQRVVVETLPVENGAIARSVTVSGNVEPIRTIAVNAQLGGALRSVEAEEGTLVTAGDVIARIDDREISAQLASVEASHELARATLDRAERLRERQVMTVAEYERDRAAFAAASAQLDQLRARLGYATVAAPITGIVTEKLVEAGDVVSPQSRLFTIADVSTMVVRVQVSELDVVELSSGDPADVVLDAFPGRLLSGRIRRVFPAADPTSRLVPVEVAITGTDARVAREGFLARVSFSLGAKAGVRLVPASAIVKDASGSDAVYVVANDRAERRLIRTGVISEGRVEILDGVEVGEMVVIVGTNNLRDGVMVRVVDQRPNTGQTLERGASQ